MSVQKQSSKLTTVALKQRKGGEKLVVLTAYDYTLAKLVDEIVDVVLVGDSLGMVFQGQPNTLSVTLDQMIYHARAVSRALSHAHLTVDMPFLSYQASVEDAIRNAGRLIAEGNAESVKLEGGVAIASTVERLVSVGIPVMGHIGLTPQSVHVMGGYKVQGKEASQREAILTDALALEDAGAFSIVLEGIPSELAEEITQRVKIPTIGIGAGVHCDGQVLVSSDMLGLFPDFRPKFVKAYATLSSVVQEAVTSYAREVKSGAFPEKQHTFYAHT